MALAGGEKLDAHNLRDFLRIKDDDRPSNLNQSTSSGGAGRHNPPGLTLHAILSAKRSPAPPRPADEPSLQRIESNMTLLDIIRQDQTSVLSGGQRDGRRSWKQLREKIRLRTSGGSGGSAWFSAVPFPVSDVPISNNNHYNNRMMMTRRQSTRFNPDVYSGESTQLDSSPGRETDRARGRFEDTISEDNRRLSGDTEETERGGGAAEQPVRMSLMALLAENDRQIGLEDPAFAMGELKEDVAEEESVSVAVAIAGEYNKCCVCMLRHKGAAFIPCGHTFCRQCSRELWAQRGNCPLCNTRILEILHIF